MTGMLLLWFQFICMVKYKAAHEITFFHGSPYAEMVASDTKNSDFGLTLAYNSGMKSLVVGAPFSDLNGRVYSCPLNDHTLETKTTSCNQIPIDIEKEVPNYSRSKSPNQHFGLGAAISVTPDGIFTCAPLLTLDIVTKNGTKFGASGTCFTYNGTSASRYFGLYEQYERDMKTKNSTALSINHFYGGVGWTTLSDVDNKLIIISKPMPKSVLFLMNMDQPTGAVQTIVEGTNAANAVYKGGAMAFGTFFKGYPRLYAFSVDISRRFGYIAFLVYKSKEKKMELLTVKNSQGRPKLVFIQDNNVGSMFGWALHSAEINGDGFTDLVVGAPMYVNSTEGGYECGAVHIYLGGIPLVSEFPKMKKLCIYSVKDASRFGSSVATADIDGDGIPEIFISAPYEDGGKGTVYIFSGSEVNDIFKRSKTANSVIVPISLIYTQKIRSPDLQSLGFSLQVMPVPNFDKYGQYLLAMGSLDGGKVALYRSIPIITVDVTAEVKGTNGKNKVREQDSNFTVSVIVNIKYPTQLAVVTGKIFVSTNIVGDAAWIEKGSNYEIMLAEKPTSHVNDVVVSLGNNKREFYMFKATVQSDTENLKRNDFDTSLVDISPRSTTEFEFGVMIACLDDCEPRLSLTFDWSGRNKTHYALGTSPSEIMSVIVRNDGGVTFGSCARIRVTGAQISFLDCKMEEGWYKCDLTDIKRNTELKKPILLDMSKPTNRDRSLTIEAVLYDDCTSNPNEEPYNYTLDYEFNTEVIYFNSTNYNRIITDHEIGNVVAEPYIEINELYTIMNNGSISWGSLPLEIHLEENTFIKDFLIPSIESHYVIWPEMQIQVNSRECIKDKLKLKYNCSVNLQPGSTVNVQSTVTLVKDKIMQSLENGTLKISCHFKMYMIPTLERLENTYLTKIVYKKTIGLENNMYVVTAIAIILGVFVMGIIIILLFKGGFFKRKDKQKLASLKNSIRLQSVRRPTVADVQYVIEQKPEQQGEDGTGNDITEEIRLEEDNVAKRRRKKASHTNQEEGDVGSRESNYSLL